MCIGLVTIVLAVATEAIRYHSFMSAKRSNSVVDINKYPHLEVFAVDIPVGVMYPQFMVQAVAECLVLITSKLTALYS